MGKSPGKWVKALIFGKKKSSRSKNSKSNDEKKRDVNQVPVSQYQTTEPKTEENLHPDNSQDDVNISATTELNAQNESDRIREEQAAIDLQAALRGCLARRSFKTLKGIIRLQALIRGHLVRRQAISTLYCMFRIVKFQALVRGRKIRNSIVGVQVGKRCNLKVMCSVEVNTSMRILKLSSNRFAQKILALSPTPMPLHFHYDSNESNSVLSWLERWSTSRCWQLPPKPKSDHPSKPLKPHTRRSSITNVQIVASEFDKPIRNLRKVSSDEPLDYIEENPELVLERIKRNLRKVNSSVLHSTNDSVQNIITEPELEKLRVNEAETMMIKKNEEEDGNVNERKKWRRVVSVPVKQEFVENKEPSPIKIKIKRSVPGYMAATVSAKAKLRGLDSPEVENSNTLTRRYSMPSMTNAGISVSPMAKTTGKLKTDRSLQLSRDGNGKWSGWSGGGDVVVTGFKITRSKPRFGSSWNIGYALI
ncbi:putative IQ motif, EF-hand binding, P-loop containing nucleoside triphosphate hydrolase [Helianthus annuus]|nr:putative IQ motif, EF-hand binding, P-loop containing nucleoside triphosphate hydrolase [Helianthus annuus]